MSLLPPPPRFIGPLNSDIYNLTGDPHWNNVVLLMHMDGANGSTTFTDVKGHAITANGNAQISTTQSKFGGASASFNGSGDYLTTPVSSDFEFGSDNFTIEGFVKTNQVATYATLIDRYAAITSRSWQLTLKNGKLCFYIRVSGGADIEIVGTSNLNDNSWHHVSWTRSGNILCLFADGNLEANYIYSGVIDGIGLPLDLGRQRDQNTNYLQGYLDEVRITRGVCRHTINVTPPAAAFPDS